MTEHLQIFDSSGTPKGRAPRPRIHRHGLWHKAAMVFVFSPDGRLVVQRRQQTQDICPGCYDLSVAEHLLPDETYEEGAVRGVKEELGIEGAKMTPLGKIRRVCLQLPALQIKDCEFQQSFSTVFAGPVLPDHREVSEICLMDLSELGAAFRRTPERYTPWFRQSAKELGLLR